MKRPWSEGVHGLSVVVRGAERVRTALAALKATVNEEPEVVKLAAHPLRAHTVDRENPGRPSPARAHR